MTFRGAGHTPDRQDARDYCASTRLTLAVLPPDRWFFEDFYEPFVQDALIPRDQGQTMSCVGFATTTAIRLLAALQGVGLPLLSSTAIYTLARELDGGDLSDHGCRPRDALRALQKYGVVEEARWPFSPRAIFEVAALDVIRSGSMAQVQAYYRITTAGEERLRELRTAISQRYVPVFAMDLTEGYDSVRKGATYVPWGANNGSHYQALIGYTATKFRVLNSWGDRWSDGGKCWLDATFIAGSNVRDIYVFTVAPVQVS